MQTAIHPKYYDIQITCACGSVLKSRSTRLEIRLDICSVCHPFFTGTQKLVDTEGRVQRFQKKYGEIKAVPPPRPGAKKPVQPRPKVAKPVAIVKMRPAKPKSEKPSANPTAVAPTPAGMDKAEKPA